MQSRLGERPLQFGRNAALEPDSDGKATRIRLLDFHSVPMRAFHLSWFAGTGWIGAIDAFEEWRFHLRSPRGA